MLENIKRDDHILGPGGKSVENLEHIPFNDADYTPPASLGHLRRRTIDTAVLW